MKRLDELGRQTKDLAKMAIDMDMDALDVVDWNADIQEILKAYKKQQMDNGLFETSKLIEDALKGRRQGELVQEYEGLTCNDEGNCIPSTVLGSFQEETWEE